LNAPVPAETEKAEAFYLKTYRRIVRSMIIIPVIVTPILWVKFGWEIALGFVAGSLIAHINFYWLRLTVEALGNAVTGNEGKHKAPTVVRRFLLRYVLIAAGAYVIFKSSANSVYGLFAGLFLPVAAILIEAVYAVYVALRRDSNFQE
jgi:ATP synthase I subunit